ncbi:MAG: zinc-binding alcohol dehydrogenase family protein [Oligoflexales bacterium]
MKAFVIHEAGGPDQLKLEERPTPDWKEGWVLIKVKAFGLNRSEYFTRIGDSPTVQFPRILGIECTGEVVNAGGIYKKGQKVMAIMGGMGRQFDGSYAEYTLVPKDNIFPFQSDLPWTNLGALPEMLQTTNGSLFQGLEIERAKNILIRGGTSSIGLCALAIAKSHGLEVISSSRSESKIDFLKCLGADHIVIDKGELETQVKKIYPEGCDRALELIGTTALKDTLKCLRRGGIACMTGILGGEWEFNSFRPMGDIPTAVKLTSYSGEAADISKDEMQKYISLVEQGKLNVSIGKIFPFSDLVEAHKLMDTNKANGKIVINLS